MSAPSFTVGHEPSAAELQFLVPIFARCTADQSVISTTTFGDSTYLQAPVAANSSYELSCLLLFDSAVTPGFKFQWVAPSGSTLDWASGAQGSGGITTATMNAEKRTITDFSQLGITFGVGTIQAVRPQGLLITSSTAGTFKMQFAQTTSNATNTTLRTGSYFTLRQVA